MAIEGECKVCKKGLCVTMILLGPGAGDCYACPCTCCSEGLAVGARLWAHQEERLIQEMQEVVRKFSPLVKAHSETQSRLPSDEEEV